MSDPTLIDLVLTNEGNADWKRSLQVTKRGEVRGNDLNVTIALCQSTDWRNRLRYNDFSNRAELDGKPVKEHDVFMATLWVQHVGIPATKWTVNDAIVGVARRDTYHPIREMLSGLVHDGEKRLDTWLKECVGAEDTKLHRAYGRMWLISLVARVMQPGCKVDTMLILEGNQGIRKSMVFEVMCGDTEWYLDQPDDPGSKAAKELQQGKWVVEYAELDKLRGTDINRIKSYMSNRKDSYRRAFGIMAEDYPRQCVFAGTVNPGATGYMQDETGARRFWPVTCGPGKVDIVWLKENRDQLLAEAVGAYDAGEHWWIEDDELEVLQMASTAARYEEDAWQEPIEAFIADKHVTTSGQIAKGALGMDVKDGSNAQTRRIGKVMHILGWKNDSIRRPGSKDKTVRCYVSPTYLATKGSCGETVLTEEEARAKDAAELSDLLR